MPGADCPSVRYINAVLQSFSRDEANLANDPILDEENHADWTASPVNFATLSGLAVLNPGGRDPDQGFGDGPGKTSRAGKIESGSRARLRGMLREARLAVGQPRADSQG